MSAQDSGRNADALTVMLAALNDAHEAEAGFGLIEVLVSAIILILVSLGTYSALDAASATSGSNRNRTLGNEVAQQDQERLRSFRAVDIANYSSTRTQVSAGVTFTIASKADWITDSSGTESCASGSAAANYVRISSTVSWPNMRGVDPIVLSSLMAPPNGSFSATQGTLAVQVIDRNGVGLPNVPVSISGATSLSDTTNSDGCVLWGGLPAGNYTRTVNVAGLVDQDGNSPSVKTVGVIGQQSTTDTVMLDTAGSIKAAFDTVPSGQAAQATLSDTFTIKHPSMSAPSYEVFGTAGTFGTNVTATPLFPFTSQYQAYSGNCTGADPTLYGVAPTYVTVNPAAQTAVTLREPALNVVVKRGSAVYPNAHVRLTAKAAGCSGTTTLKSNNAGLLIPTTSALTALDPGVPYGDYDVCADDGTRSIKVTGIQNRVAAGSAVTTLTIPTTGTSGICP
jgi:Tfp pilus assembly protein PilV